MASALRNLGQPKQAADILIEEMKRSSDELTPVVAAFLALTLADLGRGRKDLSLSLSALSGYLPRYNRSLTRYAVALATQPFLT